ncbi:SgcJ/EcaC family oxidoreductase [Albimonas sp. CAU 1670]|uniref:SgcJ/EcaC family oxidoreductase n=1 Tax=Albimonas sp. CAU 1670 TaxID=3032599 RepID=UPI0023DB0512|nr:SgcJ/EcaC family oxidoreductase [Albimonas sp. CAU 1670]MDF2234887.1 SgcJ/EcaC family oxidoreductase [Albimonas sp. CAU 1670]
MEGEAEGEAAQGEAARLARGFLAAWSAHDAAALGALFATDADFVNVTGLWWHGAERIARVHGVAFKTYFAGAVLTEERLETRALGPGAALARVRVRMEGQRGPDGAPGGPRRAMLLLVAQARPEGWRLVAAQNTDLVEGAETLLAGPDGLGGARYA